MRRLLAFGSDHFPILVAFDHAPEAGTPRDVEGADAEDREEARETIREARAALAAGELVPARAEG